MELRAAIEAFARHLTVDRGFSAHTARAYRGDLSDLAQRQPRLTWQFRVSTSLDRRILV